MHRVFVRSCRNLPPLKEDCHSLWFWITHVITRAELEKQRARKALAQVAQEKQLTKKALQQTVQEKQRVREALAQVAQEQQWAEKLAAQLRALGIDPDQLK